jgi:hypothetical protein
MDSAAAASAVGAQLLLSGPPSGQGYDQALSLAGRDAQVTLVRQGADGAVLELPSGQVITAKGDLPFPDGTRLQVRVTVQDGSVRLQVLEAHPPSSAPALAPLAQSEAGTLLQMLRDASLPQALLPLARLFADLSPSDGQRLGQAVEALSPQAQRALAALLGIRESGPAAVTRALLDLFEPVESLAELGPLYLARQAVLAPTAGERWDGRIFAESLRDLFLGFLARLDPVLSHGARPQAQAESLAKSLADELVSILKPLLGSPSEGKTSPGETAQTQERQAETGKAAAEESPIGGQAPKQPLGTGKAADADRSEATGKGQGALAEGELGKARVEKPVHEAGRPAAADTHKGQGRGQDAAAIAENLGKVLQALKSMHTAGTTPAAVPVAERAAVLALLRLSVAVLSSEAGAGGIIHDGDTGEKALGELRRAPQGSQGSQGNQGSQGSQVAQSAAGRVADGAAGQARSAQDPGARQATGEKAAPAAGTRDGKDGAAAEPAPSAPNAPRTAGRDADQTPVAEKTFPLLRQVAEALKGGEGGPQNVARDGAAAKTPVEGQGRNADGAVAPKNEGAADAVPSKSDAQRPAVPSGPDAQKLTVVPENQRPPAKSGTAANAGADRAAAAELPPGAGPQTARGPAPVQSIQDALIGHLANALAETDADTMMAAAHRYLEAMQKGAQGLQGLQGALGPGRDAPSDEAAKELGAARLVHVLEALPVPVKRAVASAVLGSFDADTKAIAETLVQRGDAPEARQGLASRLEAASPLVRQLAAVAVGLPYDSSVEKIVEAVSGGDKGALAAARGIASLKDGRGSDVGKKGDITAERPAPDAGDRIGYLLRLEALNSQSPAPQQEKDGISSWFRSIVDLLMTAKATMREAVPEARADAARVAAGPTGQRAVNPPAAPNAAPAGEQAQTWRSWLDGCVRALADPAVAKEAAFHALAAKENVNYFELPLPWTPGGSMEIWVEADADGKDRGKGDSGHRVLLGLSFSVLGETRVGIESTGSAGSTGSTGKRLNVRIWAERVEPVEAVLPQLRDELSALGFEAAVSLNSLSASQGGAVPSIKSALGAPGLNAVG